jgi:two-component system response regulator NreC
MEAPFGMRRQARLRVLVGFYPRLVRQALRTLLLALEDVDVVGEAATVGEVQALAQATRPDLALLGGALGLEAVTAVVETVPTCRALVLATPPDLPTFLQFYRVGAAGWLSPEATVEELRTALRCIAQGWLYVPPVWVDRLVEVGLDPALSRAPETGPAPLSRREREILRLVAQGLPNREIARRLGLSVKTVEAHKAHIQQKTGVRGLPALLWLARRYGLWDPLEERRDRRRREASAPASRGR